MKNKDNPNYSSAVAVMKVYQNGKLIDTLLPERRFYKAKEEPTTEVALALQPQGGPLCRAVWIHAFNLEGGHACFPESVGLLDLDWWLGVHAGNVVCLIPDRHEKAMQKVAAPVEAEELAKA